MYTMFVVWEYLDVIFNASSKVLDGKSQLCIRRGYKEWVVLMLLLQLVQQGFICGLRQPEDTEKNKILISTCDMWRKKKGGQKKKKDKACEQSTSQVNRLTG